MAHSDKNKDYKESMSRWASGVALVTLLDKNQQPQGLLISSLASVSLEPTLISFALSQQSTLYGMFCQTSFFAVNILAHNQQALAENFVGPQATRWQNLAEGTHWHKGTTTACPILPQSLAVLECAVQQRLPLGDHDMFVAQVLAATPQHSGSALTYFDRGFQELSKI
jgi:flavin reductase (DIM6/NTAB) family NADH-FMN oxidoreductase RutF